MQMNEQRAEDDIVTDYYFDSRGLIFAFVQEQLKDELNQPNTRENHYYLGQDGNLIRWLDEKDAHSALSSWPQALCNHSG